MNTHHNLVRVLEQIRSHSRNCGLVGPKNDSAPPNFFPESLWSWISPTTYGQLALALSDWMQYRIGRPVTTRPVDVTIIAIRTSFIDLGESCQGLARVIIGKTSIELKHPASDEIPLVPV